MKRRLGYSPGVRECAVRLVLTSEHDHKSRWAAIQPVAATDHAKCMKEFECDNRELKRANEILKKAAAFFAVTELDRKPK